VDPASGQALKDFDALCSKIFASGIKHFVRWSSMTDTKPDGEMPAFGSSDALSPMRGVNLEAGVVHTGRALAGTVVRDGYYTGGTYFVL
jgi:hypothetical protein